LLSQRALNAYFFPNARVKCHGHAAPQPSPDLNAYFVPNARVKGAQGALLISIFFVYTYILWFFGVNFQ
jgi:hypothetical protein